MICRMLARFVGMMLGMCMMAMRHVGMVTGCLVVSGGVMLGCGPMVFRGVFVMLGGLQMVLFTFFRHVALFLRLRDLGSRILSPCESAITK
jgi:site-specific recombinase